MGVAFNGSVLTTTSGSILSPVITVRGPYPLLTFGISGRSNTNGSVLNSPAFQGTAMTLAGSAMDGANNENYLWYLPNPGTGLGTIQGTMQPSGQWRGVTALFNFVAPSSPLEVGSTNIGTTGTIAGTVTGLSQGSALLVDQTTHETSSPMTIGAGQTALRNVDEGVWQQSSSYKIAGTETSGTMSWTNASALEWNTAFGAFTARTQTGTELLLDMVGSATSTAGSTLSWTHTVSGSNTLMLVHAGFIGTGHLSSLVYQGTALTKIIAGTSSVSQSSELWYLTGPPVGLGTFNGTWTQSGVSHGAISVSLQDVDQTVPILGSAMGTMPATSTAGTVALTTTGTNSWVVGGLGYSSATLGTEDGQNTRLGVTTTTIYGEMVSMVGPLAAGASGTIAFTHPSSIDVICVAEVQSVQPPPPPPGGANVSWRNLLGVGQ